MSKRIGLITLHNWFNYGSMLQAYALNRILNEMDGYECELIDFTPAAIVGNERSWQLYADDPQYRQLKEKYRKEIERRRMTFQKFKEFYRLGGGRAYQSDEEIEANPPVYDIYITGSDQVWNLNFRIASRAFFLAFADTDQKYAIAASIGRCKKEKLETCRAYLEQYKKIFIREEAGRKLLSGMFPEKEIETMIDPTLMLEKRQWEEIIEKQPVCKEAYIGCYATLEDELDQMMPLLRHLYQTYQKKVILFGMVAPREETWIENYVTAGPLEFILIIRDADFILTNSFHGTAFSLNFHTQFLTYHDGLENPRKEGLLHMVHLERRMVHTLEECRMICEEEIDFTEPERILQQERKQALYKIKEMLANGA